MVLAACAQLAVAPPPPAVPAASLAKLAALCTSFGEAQHRRVVAQDKLLAVLTPQLDQARRGKRPS